MADGTVRIQEDTTGKELDNTVVNGALYRQRVHIGGSTLADIIEPLSATPGASVFALPVRNIPSGVQPVSGTVDVATMPAVTVSGSVAVTGAFFQATQPISAASLPLPTGASTEATLATLNGKVPALGQALAASSVPVVLTAAQITTLTPPAAITGFATETTLAAVNTKTPALGQAAMAASRPVVIASNQTTVPTFRMNALVAVAYDYLSQAQGATTDTWTYKTGGSGGSTVATVTITYTATDKLTILNVART